MTQSLIYNGKTINFSELAITGKQANWMPSQIKDSSDTDAALLLASGFFSIASKPLATQNYAYRLSKIKTAIQNAVNNNPVELPPLAPAPTWAINTIYGGMAIVRGTGADAANLYIMAGNTSNLNRYGTSAASGTGPSGTTNAVVADNTCNWFYIGKANASTTYPLYSTVTPAAATDVMNGYISIVANTVLSTLGLTRVYNNDLATQFARFGGHLKMDLGQAYSSPLGANSSTLASPAYGAGRAFMEFTTSAQQWIAFQCSGGINGGYGSTIIDSYDIEINGRKLSESPVLFNTPSGNFSILLNLVPFGNVNKTIRITAKQGANWTFIAPYQAYVKDDETVWPTNPPNNLKVTLEGDSTAQGGYFGQASGRDLIEHQIMNQLGFTNCYNNAIGGTSATNISNGGANTTFGQRLPDVVASGMPDVHIIMGFHNEIANYQGANLAARRAAILQYFKDCRSIMPDTTIVVIPTLPLAGDTLTTGGASSLLDLETDVKNQFIAWGDTNSLFIPFQLKINPFYKGNSFANTSWYHSAGGSAPYADSHPVPRGYRVWSQYIVDSIRSYFLTN